LRRSCHLEYEYTDKFYRDTMSKSIEQNECYRLMIANAAGEDVLSGGWDQVKAVNPDLSHTGHTAVCPVCRLKSVKAVDKISILDKPVLQVTDALTELYSTLLSCFANRAGSCLRWRSASHACSCLIQDRRRPAYLW
jgi:hypothetical protein